MKTNQTNTPYIRKVQTILLLVTIAALTLWNCTFFQDNSQTNPNPGDTSLSSAPIEQAFPGEQGDLLTGYALLNGKLRHITYERIHGCNVFQGGYPHTGRSNF